MNRHNRLICLKVALLSLALVIFRNEPGYCMEPEKIFAWVAGQMNIADAGPLPTVFYVDKAELQSVFLGANRRSYRRWEARYGKREAKKFLNTYLEALAGMFDPETNRIYIGRFLTQCRQEAVLAHEMTHYIQARTEGRIDPEEEDAGQIKLRQEMQAAIIEKRYIKAFCADTNGRHAAPMNP